MKSWPALEIRDLGADASRPDLFQAALTDYDVAGINERLGNKLDGARTTICEDDFVTLDHRA